MAAESTEIPLVVPITDSWKRFILWANANIPHGDITVRIVNGSPTDLLSFKPRVRFDHPLSENVLSGVSFDNSS